MSSLIHFYDCLWTEERENRFIELAIDAKEMGTWRAWLNWRNPVWVERDTLLLNSEFGFALPVAFYAEKVERLFERHNNFQFIMRHYGVYWNEQSNVIAVDDETFSELATLTTLAHAYKEKGEPQYRRLCALFEDEE
ncbi:hypothetical protein C2S51_029606 [Perilla frutescens var. frutescens]|nr:hypothetical protein C2S51_029606 [Perilla frutescens var. frutescens]